MPDAMDADTDAPVRLHAILAPVAVTPPPEPTPRLLVVDVAGDTRAVVAEALAPLQPAWEVRTVRGADAGLTHLESGSCDLLLADTNAAMADGTRLMDTVAARWPATVRVGLVDGSSRAGAVHEASICHQMVELPVDAEHLRDVLQRAAGLGVLVKDPALRALVGAVGHLPSIPAVYAELCALLEDPDAPVAKLTALLECDAALVAKLQQLVNSAFFGRGQHVKRLDQTVQLLGMTVLRSVVLTHAVYSQCGPVVELELAEEQAHSLRVAVTARRLVGSSDADAAFMAGLLHDVGKLVLAMQAPQMLADDRREAVAQRTSLHAVEQRRRGATHAEIGGYLMGLWNLAPVVVEAVAFHHAPARAPAGQRPVLAAVHVANVLDSVQRGDACAIAELDAEYLAAQGLPPSLDDWRMLLELTAGS